MQDSSKMIVFDRKGMPSCGRNPNQQMEFKVHNGACLINPKSCSGGLIVRNFRLHPGVLLCKSLPVGRQVNPQLNQQTDDDNEKCYHDHKNEDPLAMVLHVRTATLATLLASSCTTTLIVVGAILFPASVGAHLQVVIASTNTMTAVR
jgi:hypothetical protein